MLVGSLSLHHDPPADRRALGRDRRARHSRRPLPRCRCSSCSPFRCSSPFRRSIRGRTDPAAIKPDVLSCYLNAPFFIVRTVLALAGWTALAILLPRTAGARGRLLAALGLVFHGVVISSVAIDWYLSLEAPFTSSSFGASVAISALVAALAWAALLAPAPSRRCRRSAILAALLLAFVLGITYIDFMAVLVIWYGDLPREEAWFVERDALAVDGIGGRRFHPRFALPIFALLLARVRNSRDPLRAVGAGVLVGLACLRRLSDRAAVRRRWRCSAALVAIVGIGLGYCGLDCSGVTALIAAGGRPMSAEEHIHYAAGIAGDRQRAVLLCALGALVLLCRRHRRSPRNLPARRAGQDRAGPASLSAAARRHQPSRSRGAPAPRRRAAANASKPGAGRTIGTPLVQIPIERAMQLMAQKGAAAYDPLLPPPPEKQP